ncbi:hypothetical protein K438DRAFT_1777119 [Mycena galopus ATCC 62051]|nr:hypothetical protein K438DRAFT_1777119 [Mycena galopus ATCC 62051]
MHKQYSALSQEHHERWGRWGENGGQQHRQLVNVAGRQSFDGAFEDKAYGKFHFEADTIKLESDPPLRPILSRIPGGNIGGLDSGEQPKYAIYCLSKRCHFRRCRLQNLLLPRSEIPTCCGKPEFHTTHTSKTRRAHSYTAVPPLLPSPWVHAVEWIWICVWIGFGLDEGRKRANGSGAGAADGASGRRGCVYTGRP